MAVHGFAGVYFLCENAHAVHRMLQAVLIDIFYLFDASSPAPELSANFQPFMAESQPTFSHLWLKVTNDF